MTPPPGLGLIGRRSPFVRQAHERGVPVSTARRLEAGASDVSGGSPGRILDDRELFEEAALLAVIGDAGNLELDYRIVEELAGALDTLGLGRVSDVPDPFRRVWLSDEQGERVAGVVLTRSDSELSVFTHPRSALQVEIGGSVTVAYRGFDSSVSYELHLEDSVRLPGAHVFHLNRGAEEGAIGRQHQRFAIQLDAELRAWSMDDARGEAVEAEVIDLSMGGCQLIAASPFDAGQVLDLEVELPGHSERPMRMRGEVRWKGGERPEGTPLGIEFDPLDPEVAEDLTALLHEYRQHGLPDFVADEATPEATSDPGDAEPGGGGPRLSGS